MKKKGSRGKGKKSSVQKQAEINRAMKRVEPIVVPLTELFAVVDDVFTEEGAFTQEHIKKSLGRIHREWKKTRAALDPEFDPKDYEKRPRTVATSGSQSPLATALQRSSTGRKRISEPSRNPKGKSGKRSASRSAKDAPSSGRASRGR